LERRGDVVDERMHGFGDHRLAAHRRRGYRSGPGRAPKGSGRIGPMATTPIAELGRRAEAAAAAVAAASTAQKNEALRAAADLLEARSAEIIEANAADVAAAEADGATATVVDRLRLDESKVSAMAAGLRQVASLADPVGEVLDGWV